MLDINLNLFGCYDYIDVIFVHIKPFCRYDCNTVLYFQCFTAEKLVPTSVCILVVSIYQLFILLHQFTCEPQPLPPPLMFSSFIFLCWYNQPLTSNIFVQCSWNWSNSIFPQVLIVLYWMYSAGNQSLSCLDVSSIKWNLHRLAFQLYKHSSFRIGCLRGGV